MYVTACFSERFVAIFIKGTTIANRRLALEKKCLPECPRAINQSFPKQIMAINIRPVKIWPVLLCALVSGCSLQHHTDRAERSWLNAKLPSAELHSVSLTPEIGSSPDTVSEAFLTSSGASTYLLGQIESRDINELSGMAPVIGERDKYWAINDSGNRPQLFAFNGSGKNFGIIDLPVRNRDWEDLATFKLNAENWIAISETGDNVRRHSVSSIYFFKQPDIKDLPKQLELAYQLDFSYEDGPRNVESMSVSIRERKIYLISKDKAPRIYTLPLPTINDSDLTNKAQVAKYAGQLAELQATDDDAWWERAFAAGLLLTPTGLDFSAGDRMAVVSNYRHVYLFSRSGNEAWAAALSRAPKILTSHRMEQSESVAFSADGREVIVSSEGVNAPLLTIRPSVAAARL